jgi:hypothetical protein
MTKFRKENGTHLFTLVEKEDLSITIEMRDEEHPISPDSVDGLRRHEMMWREKLSYNGATIAPYHMMVKGDHIHIRAAKETYSMNRGASDLWQRLQENTRNEILSTRGFHPAYSRFLGTACAVIGSDGMLVLARRSMNIATEPGQWAPAIGEGMDDSDIGCDGTADVRGCILRGAFEELGLKIDEQDAKTALRLHSITNNHALGEIVVNGSLDFRLIPNGPTSQEIMKIATNYARDAWERDKYTAIPLTHEAIQAFAHDRPEEDGRFSGYGLITANLALKYEREPAHEFLQSIKFGR